MAARAILRALPNILSSSRVVLAAAFVVFKGVDARLGLVGVAGATDFLDGYIARHWDQVSELGKVLDPVADRLLFFVGVGGILIDGTVPVWFAWAVLVREACVGLATVALAVGGSRRIDGTWAGTGGRFGTVAAPLSDRATQPRSTTRTRSAVSWNAASTS